MKSIKGVLFDLDGTLLDTAPDLLYALNCLRQERQLPEMPLSFVRPHISLGSKQMIKLMLDIDETHPEFSGLREKFFALYEKHIADATRLFPNVDNVLAHLDHHSIPWGIVTNKLTRHTNQVLKALKLHNRPLCTISGDTLSKYKPDPAPILHACNLIKVNPANCLYVGDSLTDVQASKAAGTKSLVALYGYIGAEENPQSWQADGYIHEAAEIIDWVTNKSP